MKFFQWIIFFALLGASIKGCASGGFIAPAILAIMSLFAHPKKWFTKPSKITDEEFVREKIFLRTVGVILLIIVYLSYPADNKNPPKAENKDTSKVKSGEAYGGSAVADKTTEQKISVDSARYYKSKADSLLKKQKFAAAMLQYSDALRLGYTNDSVWRGRGKCLIKLGMRREAASDLKQIQDVTDEDKKLYDKANPIKKRITGYCSKCCDGTFSPSCATGRGACSHHGGVCEPNAPEYEEYREFGD
jgi:tetratricopeptide (TPR) repeat protein